MINIIFYYVYENLIKDYRQQNYVRLNGKYYLDRLMSTKSKVDIDDFISELPASKIERYILLKMKNIFSL